MPNAVTIVLPTYNRAALLQRALSAFALQTYPSFDVFVYDNASTDDTADVVKSFAERDPRVHYFRHEQNVGPTENFLFGMRRVATPFFAFASDDDVPLPEFLRVTVEQFQRFPDAGISAMETLEMTPQGQLVYAPLATWPRVGYFAAGEAIPSMLDGRHPSWNTILFSSRAIETLGLFDATLGLVMDLEYTLRTAARFPVVLTHEPGGIFIRHSLSAGEHARADVATYFERAIRRVVEQPGISDGTTAELQAGLRRMLGARLLESAVRSLARGERDAAVACIERYRAEGFAKGAMYRAVFALAQLPDAVLRAMPVDAAIAARARLRGRHSAAALRRAGFSDEPARGLLRTLV